MYAPSYILCITICCTCIQTYYHKRGYEHKVTEILRCGCLWIFQSYCWLHMVSAYMLTLEPNNHRGCGSIMGTILQVLPLTSVPSQEWQGFVQHPAKTQNSSGQCDNDRQPTNTSLSRCWGRTDTWDIQDLSKEGGSHVCSWLSILASVSSRTILELHKLQARGGKASSLPSSLGPLSKRVTIGELIHSTLLKRDLLGFSLQFFRSGHNPSMRWGFWDFRPPCKYPRAQTPQT